MHRDAFDQFPDQAVFVFHDLPVAPGNHRFQLCNLLTQAFFAGILELQLILLFPEPEDHFFNDMQTISAACTAPS